MGFFRKKKLGKVVDISLHEYDTDSSSVLTDISKTQDKEVVVSKKSTEISAYEKSTITTTTTSFDDLIDDVQLYILSFADANDARSMLSTCKKCHNLLKLSKESHTLWIEYINRLWPKTKSTASMSTSTKHCCCRMDIKDDMNIPFIAATNAAALVGMKDDLNTCNLSALIGMAAKTQPDDIDESKFLPSNKTEERDGEEGEEEEEEEIQFQTSYMTRNDTECEEKIIQFVGRVGPNDRCIVSNKPFPKPIFVKSLRDYTFDVSTSMSGKGISNEEMMTIPYEDTTYKNHTFFWRQTKKMNSRRTQHPIWRPFVVPHVSKYNAQTKHKEVNLTPRLVAYYEVTIHAKSPERDSNGEKQEQPDCVAVGISSSEFKLHSKMPGWDALSYGYHSDDGGLFHGPMGSRAQQHGPTFGAGDTIGCGIDYITGGIFFTKNGSFLGYGWSNIDLSYLQSDIYPTVGVDTNNPLSVNFGNERSFRFDLSMFIKRQHAIVNCCLAPLTSSYNISKFARSSSKSCKKSKPSPVSIKPKRKGISKSNDHVKETKKTSSMPVQPRRSR